MSRGGKPAGSLDVPYGVALDIPATGDAGLIVPVERRGSLRGRLADADSGRGIAGASLAWGRNLAIEPLPRGNTAVTDGDGRFVLPDLPAVPVTVLLTDEAWQTVPSGPPELPGVALANQLRRSLDPAARSEAPAVRVRRAGVHSYSVEVPGGAEGDEVVVFARRRGVVTGRVRHAAGGAVAGARVTAWWSLTSDERRGELAASPSVFSDEDGRFVLPGVASGERVTLLARAPDGAVGRLETDTAGARVDVGDILIAAGGRLHLSVIDEAGTPLAGVHAILRRRAPEPVAGGIRAAMGISDGSGEITFRDLEPGTVGIAWGNAECRGWLPRERGTLQVEIGAEPARVVQTFVRAHEVSGRLRETSGRPRELWEANFADLDALLDDLRTDSPENRSDP